MSSFSAGTGLYINGEWRTTDRLLEVRHKFTGELLGELHQAGPADVDRAVRAADQAMRQNPLSAYERYSILRRLADLFGEHHEELALTIAREGGKPLKDARAEVSRAQQTVIVSSEEAKRIHGETVPLDAAPGTGHRFGLYMRVPVGVVAAISPFNFPLNLVVHKVAPAIAAGCAVVLKPASTTPLTAVMLANLLTEAGLPPGYLNLVVGPGSAVGDQLVKHPAVRMVTFTGSPGVGLAIHQAAGLKKITLELGNNSANIVHRDADVVQAASLLAQRSYGSAGQFCVSVQRIYVHEDIVARYQEEMLAAIARLKVGNPEDPTTDVGPLITDSEARRVHEWVDEARTGGARILTGGERSGPLMAPTLLTDVVADMKVVAQEVFGPVASIIPYTDFDEAIRMVNEGPYGLQAGVFTHELDLAWRAAAKIETGGVNINDTSSFRADHMPYGGQKDSGIGREGPRFAVEEMTDIRMVTFNFNR